MGVGVYLYLEFVIDLRTGVGVGVLKGVWGCKWGVYFIYTRSEQEVNSESA